MIIVLVIGFISVTSLSYIGYVPGRTNFLEKIGKWSFINIYDNIVYNGWISIYIFFSICFFFYELFASEDE